MKDDFERSCIRSYVDQNKIQALRNILSEYEDLEYQADIIKMLGDSTRLKILYALARGSELCVCDLSDILKKGVSTISHQLRRLRDRGLVVKRRDGLTIYYSLAKNKSVKDVSELVKVVLLGSRELEDLLIES